MSEPTPASRYLLPQVPRLHVEVLAGACREYDSSWGGAGQPRIQDDFARLYSLHSGQARIACADGPTVNLQPGMLGLIPAGRAARYHCSGTIHLAWVHFRIEIIAMVDVFARWQPPLTTPCTQTERAQLDRLIQGLVVHTPTSAFGRTASLLHLLTPFLPPSWDELLPTSENQRRLQPALDSLVEDPTHPWTLSELARLVHLHPTYFSNLFRETFGTAPLRYLKLVRLRRARELLTVTKLRVGDVATECGYRDPLHFSRAFRRATGVSPTQFRASGGMLQP